MEEIVPISKFKATCLSLLDRVNKTGQPILVTKKGEPIAQVVPPPKPKKPASWLGSFKSTGKIKGGYRFPCRVGNGLGSPEKMKLLLDTHIWLWSLLEPDRLTKKVSPGPGRSRRTNFGFHPSAPGKL